MSNETSVSDLVKKLFDEEIESIRTFDPETQRSLEKIDAIQLFPAREFPLTDESIELFRQAFRSYFPEVSPKNSLYVDVSKGITPSGIEYYLPLFVEQTATLFDYLPSTAIVVSPTNFNTTAVAFYAEAEERYLQRKYDVNRPLLKPEHLFLSAEDLAVSMGSFAQISLDNPEASIELKDAKLADATNSLSVNFACHVPSELIIDGKLNQPAQALKQFIANFDGKILFVAESAGR